MKGLIGRFVTQMGSQYRKITIFLHINNLETKLSFFFVARMCTSQKCKVGDVVDHSAPLYKFDWLLIFNVEFEDICTGFLASCIHVGCLLRLFFDLGYGGCMFLRNIGWLSTDCTAIYPRRQNSSIFVLHLCLIIVE
jgi:hypothetical protein